jgi:hypothetical protein
MKGAVVGAAVGTGITLMSGWVANAIRTPQARQYTQAKLDFITAILRKESGAAISVGEFVSEDKRYFPQPGDDPFTIAQKAQARQNALATLAHEAGRPLLVLPQVEIAPKAPVRVFDPLGGQRR